MKCERDPKCDKKRGRTADCSTPVQRRPRVHGALRAGAGTPTAGSVTELAPAGEGASLEALRRGEHEDEPAHERGGADDVETVAMFPLRMASSRRLTPVALQLSPTQWLRASSRFSERREPEARPDAEADGPGTRDDPRDAFAASLPAPRAREEGRLAGGWPVKSTAVSAGRDAFGRRRRRWRRDVHGVGVRRRGATWAPAESGVAGAGAAASGPASPAELSRDLDARRRSFGALHRRDPALLARAVAVTRCGPDRPGSPFPTPRPRARRRRASPRGPLRSVRHLDDELRQSRLECARALPGGLLALGLVRGLRSRGHLEEALPRPTRRCRCCSLQSARSSCVATLGTTRRLSSSFGHASLNLLCSDQRVRLDEEVLCGRGIGEVLERIWRRVTACGCEEEEHEDRESGSLHSVRPRRRPDAKSGPASRAGKFALNRPRATRSSATSSTRSPHARLEQAIQ